MKNNPQMQPVLFSQGSGKGFEIFFGYGDRHGSSIVKIYHVIVHFFPEHFHFCGVHDV